MKKYWKHILAVIVGIFLFLFYLDIIPPIKMPVRILEVFAGRRVKATHIPFKVEKTYGTTNSCGKNCQTMKIYYEGQDEILTLTASDEMNWVDDPKWRKDPAILSGANYHFSDKNDVQKLEWQDEEKDLEMAVEYKGYQDLKKEQMVHIAEEVQIGWQSEEERERFSF